MQRDRCDWPDILNLIYATALELDWDHLFRRLDDDAPLLEAVLTIFEMAVSPARRPPSQPRVATFEKRSERELHWETAGRPARHQTVVHAGAGTRPPGELIDAHRRNEPSRERNSIRTRVDG
jgi:hypothetical protein